MKLYKNRLIKLLVLFMNLSLIVSCKQNPTTNSLSSSTQDSSDTYNINFNEHLLKDLNDNFSYSKGSYISQSINNAKVFTTPLSTGEFSSSLNYQKNSGEHYLIFNHNKNDNTYDAYGINKENKLQLVHFDGINLNINKTFDYKVENEIDLKVKIYEAEDIIELFLDNEKIDSLSLDILKDNYLGIYTSSPKTKFMNIKMDSNPFKELNNPDSFTTVYGKSIYKNNGIQMKGTNNLVINNGVSLRNGSFEVTVNVQESGKNAVGIVFRLDDMGKTSYYKNHVTCYYLCFGITGSLTLIKYNSPGVSETLKYYITPYFQKNLDHKLKVILNEGMIHILCDDSYCFGYEDSEFLTGDKIGFCNLDENGYYKDLKVVSTNDKLLVKDFNNNDKYDVVNGNFVTLNELTYSTKANSMMVSKDKIPTDGTLQANIGTIDEHGHGLIFRLTKPNKSEYYMSENGLSYYYIENCGDQYYRLARVENGNITYSKKSYVAMSIGHGGNVKVVMIGSTIYVYFTDRLVIKYDDPNPLIGQYYGYKCTNKYGLFKGDITYSTSTKIDTADYLIFGHSYTYLWLAYKKDFNALGDNILNVGIGGARTLHYVTTANEMACYQPKWGIYWNGINDINADVAISTMPENIEKTMLTIKNANPDYQCVIIGINRCTYQKSIERYSQIHEANLKYKELCDKYDWMHFLDVEYLYCNEQGTPQSSWFIDNLHPTYEAYTKVADLVIDIIQENS